jgi:hypothetical protein
MRSHLNRSLRMSIASLFLGAAAFAQEGTQGALFRVHCGGPAFVDSAGHFWEADAHYEGGQVFGIPDSMPILNTNMPGLYRSERWNDPASPMKYTFPVRAGGYRVNLHFAEIYDQNLAAGKRVFDVIVNGSVVAADLDIFAQAGAYTPLVLDFLTQAVDGKVVVEFANKTNNAKIAGIEVLPQTPFRATAAPYRIHCGGDDYIDSHGNYWEGDGHFNDGGTYVSTTTVSGTDMSFLYQTERFNGNGDLAYTFDVLPGSYTVRLHFAEIFFQTSGQRVFGVDINGVSAIEGLDVASEAGANTALVKEFAAADQEGKITISFRNSVENAKISAIEILEGIPTRAAKVAGKASEGFRIQAGAGSLAIRPSAAGSYSASILDVRGRRVALLQGREAQSVSGLRPGVYVVEIRAGKSAFSRSVPVF